MSDLQWIDGPWEGRLAVSAPPRGGDWLEDEVARWRTGGVNTVVSLLTSEEEAQLELTDDGGEAKRGGLEFRSYPILDRDVPESAESFANEIEVIDLELSRGRNVLVHCRQGIGRTGLVASCLLVREGFKASAAVERVSAGRGLEMPETVEQRLWIDKFEARLAMIARA